MTPHIWTLLDLFLLVGDAGANLSLSGSAAADVLETWAECSGLPVEREQLSRTDSDGTTVTWTLVRVVVRGHMYITASRDDDAPLETSFDRTARAITGQSADQVNAELDLKINTYPHDEDLP